jgi:hypothetical protein
LGLSQVFLGGRDIGHEIISGLLVEKRPRALKKRSCARSES